MVEHRKNPPEDDSIEDAETFPGMVLTNPQSPTQTLSSSTNDTEKSANQKPFGISSCTQSLMTNALVSRNQILDASAFSDPHSITLQLHPIPREFNNSTKNVRMPSAGTVNLLVDNIVGRVPSSMVLYIRSKSPIPPQVKPKISEKRIPEDLLETLEYKDAKEKLRKKELARNSSSGTSSTTVVRLTKNLNPIHTPSEKPMSKHKVTEIRIPESLIDMLECEEAIERFEREERQKNLLATVFQRLTTDSTINQSLHPQQTSLPTNVSEIRISEDLLDYLECQEAIERYDREQERIAEAIRASLSTNQSVSNQGLENNNAARVQEPASSTDVVGAETPILTSSSVPRLNFSEMAPETTASLVPAQPSLPTLGRIEINFMTHLYDIRNISMCETDNSGISYIFFFQYIILSDYHSLSPTLKMFVGHNRYYISLDLTTSEIRENAEMAREFLNDMRIHYESVPPSSVSSLRASFYKIWRNLIDVELDLVPISEAILLESKKMYLSDSDFEVFENSFLSEVVNI